VGSVLVAAGLVVVPVARHQSASAEPRAALAAATADVYSPPATTLNAAKVKKAVRKYLTGTPLGPHVRVDIAGVTGPAVYDYGTGPAIPASTTKLLTSAAVLHYYGGKHTFATTAWLDPVATGVVPTLVLKGGGDPLLTRYVYAGDAVKPPLAGLQKLARVAARELAADGVKQVRLRFDTSLFKGRGRPPQWRPEYAGFMSKILPLWTDEGRTGGKVVQAKPALVAAQKFAAALHQYGIRTLGPISSAKTQPGAAEVSSVSSGHLTGIIRWMLHWSDNAVAEVLGHQAGVAIGNGSFSGGVTGVREALTSLGVPLTGVTLYDGSGLSRDDRIPPETLVSVLQQADQPGSVLAPIKAGLPVAGVSGTLADRFTDKGDPAKGVAMAKTGSLTGVASLAGYTRDADGTPIVFAIMADKTPSYTTAETWEDKIVTSLTACHCG